MATSPGPSAPPGVKYNICCVARFTSYEWRSCNRFCRGSRDLLEAAGGRGSWLLTAGRDGAKCNQSMGQHDGQRPDEWWQPHGAFPFAAATSHIRPPSALGLEVWTGFERRDPEIRWLESQLILVAETKCTSLSLAVEFGFTNQLPALKTYFDNWAVRLSSWQRALFTPLDVAYYIYARIWQDMLGNGGGNSSTVFMPF